MKDFLNPLMKMESSHWNNFLLNVNIEDFESKQTFDNIICTGALEFIESPESVFSKSSEFLANSGRLVILIPPKNIFGFFLIKS